MPKHCGYVYIHAVTYIRSKREREIFDTSRGLGFAQVSACFIITITNKW